MAKFYEYEALDNSEKSIPMNDYKGKTILVVNTASKCGFTYQYEGLQKLYEKHKDQGFIILGFPCDQFAHQEPGSDSEIASFCKLNFGVTFPLFKKVDVNGKNSHPLYKYLKKELSGFLGGKIKWNFTKFLISPEGKPIKRYASTVEPEKIGIDLQKLL